MIAKELILMESRNRPESVHSCHIEISTRLGAQQWVRDHFPVANPVEEMIRRSNLAERTFKRRFASATGLTPIDYVQRLRVGLTRTRFIAVA